MYLRLRLYMHHATLASISDLPFYLNFMLRGIKFLGFFVLFVRSIFGLRTHEPNKKMYGNLVLWCVMRRYMGLHILVIFTFLLQINAPLPNLKI